MLNLTLSPKAKPPETPPQDIIVNGQSVGDLRQHDFSSGTRQWQAAINFKSRLLACGTGSFYGWGDTQEEAIADAIEKGRAAASEQMEFVTRLAAEIGYEIKGAT